ncbi:MAG TPA: glycosyltransferase family 2 protein [Capillimicrobium sp.]|nr:glycosyltransferase family 2 protein [Capillimicrobium sp.]
MTDPTDAPEVSFVIVTWRAKAETLACLASIERHADVPYEVIVVDDGSGDGTPDAVREAFPAARVVAKPVNEGLVAGRNAALPLVRGRKVLMLDADTELHPGTVRELVRVLDEHPEVGLVGPKLVGTDGELQPSSRRWPPFLIPVMRRGPYARLDPNPRAHQRHLMQDFDHATARSVVWVSGAAQMWRADLPSRIGPYDRHVSSYGGEDLDWCLRVWAAGLKVRYVPDAVVTHHWQAVTRRNQFGRKAWRAFRDWYYLQWKHRRLRRDPRLAEANA